MHVTPLVAEPAIASITSAMTSTDAAAIDVPVPAISPKTPPQNAAEALQGGSVLPPGSSPPGPTLPAALRGAPEASGSDEEELPRPKAQPKLGKISFNMKGAKDSMAAAQAKVQAEEAIAAARARRQNTRDASTQTVRHPEQDGEIVTVWRLRRRGMESFPHFPKPEQKKKRKLQEHLLSLEVDEEGGAGPQSGKRSQRAQVAQSPDGVSGADDSNSGFDVAAEVVEAVQTDAYLLAA